MHSTTEPASWRVPVLVGSILLLASIGNAQLGAVPYPKENPLTEAKRVLGKILYWDEQLSSSNTVSCGTCHIPSTGGTDPRSGIWPGPDKKFKTADDIIGSPGLIRSDDKNRFKPDPLFGFGTQVTRRASQAFLGTQWAKEQFWDGRAGTQYLNPITKKVSIASGGGLENQVTGPPTSDVEMAHEKRSWAQILVKLKAVKPLQLATNVPKDMANVLKPGVSYGDLFKTAFGDTAITEERIAFAIATYERTLSPDQTPWDLYVNGNKSAMTTNQITGYNLMLNHTICFNCHTLPQFTDNNFHAIGLRPPADDTGRKEVTGLHSDRGKFKTPTLRNVGLRKGRLTHVGWIKDVKDMIDFYTAITLNTGHTQYSENQDFRISRILMPTRWHPMVSDFLENGLTDPRVKAATFPFDRPTLWSERLPLNPSTYGSGSTGTGSIVPIMLAESPPNHMNVDFKIGVGNGLGGSTALLLMSLGSADMTLMGIPVRIDLGKLVLNFPTVLNGTGAGNGYTTLQIPLGDTTSSIGLDLFGQWFVSDSSATGGFAATPGAKWKIF
jgi:cytochrome c peroxidase